MAQHSYSSYAGASGRFNSGANSRGSMSIESALLSALVGIAIISVMSTLGSKLSAGLETAAAALAPAASEERVLFEASPLDPQHAHEGSELRTTSKSAANGGGRDLE